MCWEKKIPQAIQAGISLDDFWHEDSDYVNLMIKTYYQRINYESWLHGLYVYDAVTSALGGLFDKNAKYLKEPYRIAGEETENIETKVDQEMEFRNALLECY